MNWVIKPFNKLTTNELYEILKVRTEIFVVEQECPYPEVDGRDKECLHVWIEEEGEISAYCRLVPPVKYGGNYSIGRVLVVKGKRGAGYARSIMNKAIELLKEEGHTEFIFLQGQEHLRNFYGSFGFKEVSEVYLEDDIPHVDMLMRVK
ncbi:GNAT family N-acetyltransferase [Halobacillus rhizosphaerae]|uniref:GNAT family N-acetyltransferase n=1 Tax=Halobacillus rhizosphaerae TaxID=3064889 RepID=UPI00398ADED0